MKNDDPIIRITKTDGTRWLKPEIEALIKVCDTVEAAVLLVSQPVVGTLHSAIDHSNFTTAEVDSVQAVAAV